MTSTRRAGLLSSATNVAGFACTGLALTLAARVLGPSEFGRLAVGLALAVFLAAGGNLSLGQIAHRLTTANPQAWRSRAIHVVIGLPATASLAIGLVLLLLRMGHGLGFLDSLSSPVFLASLALGPLLALEISLAPVMAAQNSLEMFNTFRLAGRVLTLALTGFASVQPLGPSFFLILQIIGPMCAVVIGARALIRGADLSFPNRKEWLEVARGILILHPSSLGAFAITWLNVLLVGSFAGVAQAGYYQTTWTMVQFVLTVPQGAMLVIYGHVASQGADEAWRAGRRDLGWFSALTLLGTVAAWALAGPAVQFVLGSEYKAAAGIFRIMVWMVPGAALGLMMTPQWIGRGLFAMASLITIAIAVLGVLMALLLVPEFGARGAAVATVLAHMLSLLVQLGFIFALNRKTTSA